MNTASHLLVVASATLLLSSAVTARAADAPSAADKAFVGKVSQGGMYEFEASKLAEDRATAQDVKDQAVTEVHDHGIVNRELKKLADAAGIAVAADLNATFAKRLEKLKSAADSEFDAAYLDDMEKIHDKDEKLFAKEAEEGTEPFKTFAHQTDQIVKRHIGSLHGT